MQVDYAYRVEQQPGHQRANQSRSYWFKSIPTVRMNFEQEVDLKQSHQIDDAKRQASSDRRTQRTVTRRQDDAQYNVDDDRGQRVEEHKLLMTDHVQNIANWSRSSVEHVADRQGEKQWPCDYE